MNSTSTAPRTRVRARGAVLVEFIVALTPLLMTFFSLIQLGKMMTAQLAFKHAASVASRAAAVIMNEPQNPKATGKKEEVEQAAMLALGDFVGAFNSLDATVTGGNSPSDPVMVELKGTYDCTVPLGKTIVCGFGGTHDFKPVRSTLPLYGARYKVGD
jgi:Flp pilus assembly protein TadG